jgi:hypothetical protein
MSKKDKKKKVKSKHIRWILVTPIILSGIGLCILGANLFIQSSQIQIEQSHAEPRFDVTYTYSESSDFSSDNDKTRPVLQSHKALRLINTKTLDVLENQAVNEDIVWLRIENKSVDAQAINTLSTKFWLKEQEYNWQEIKVARTLASDELLEVPVTTVKVEGNPFRYLDANIKFDKVYLNLDQNGRTLVIPVEAPPLVPAVSVWGEIVIVTVITGFMTWILMRRKTAVRI